MNDEVWREVPGWPGYFVSSLGRVRGRRGRIMRPSANYRNGYRYVGLANADGTGKSTSFNVHRLVLEAFVGLRPDGMTASHLDGDPANNALSNLVWEPHSDNMRRQRGHGTQRDQRGVRNSMAKLTDAAVAQIRMRASAGETQSSLATEFRVSTSLIGLVVARKIWRHVA
ncbi:NUMOD4 motif-containing HNH endonuclease [Streptomyces sp. NPDC001520]|uniref:NUMOD4 motif-containing HNH endonuclease n=1 Tax=Streptomyces sp. NPDC001520 TaxID=3364581 RepID=UPI0036C8FCDB